MNQIAPVHDASDLVATVERARALLTEGDVVAARVLAAHAADTAESATRAMERLRAGEELVAKARRLHGDALLIEFRAASRLADEWDAAQARGEASTGGRPKKGAEKTVGGADGFTAAEAGLTRHEIAEARKLRDAEAREPGIVARAIAARIAAGLSPSRANLRAAVGTDSAGKAERGDNLYETPPEGSRTLFCLERFSPLIWEPACGKGAITRVAEDAGYAVLQSDLRDRGTADAQGEVQRAADFLALSRDEVLSWTGGTMPDIVTNPPYGEALNRFVAHALTEMRPRRMALLLNLNFLCGFEDADRNTALDALPPARCRVFSRRLPMMHRDGWTGPEASSRMNTAWFVWEMERGAYRGPIVTTRHDWKDFEGAAMKRPLVPGGRGSRLVGEGER